MRASYAPVPAASKARTASFFKSRSASFFGGARVDEDGGGDDEAGEADRPLRDALASARSAAAGGYGTGGGAGAGGIYRGLHSSVKLDGGEARRYCCGRLSARGALLAGLGALLLALALVGVATFYTVAPGFVRDRIKASTLVFSALDLTQPVADGAAPALALGSGGGGGGGGGGPGLGIGIGALPPAWASASAFASASASAAAQASAADPAAAVGAGAGRWGFTLGMRGVLSGLSPLGGTLASFEATMLHGGTPVATFQMPALTAAAGVDNAVAISAPVTVLSLAAFSAFGAAIVNGDSVEVTLRGTTSVAAQVAGLTIVVPNVEFDKTVSFGGARGLAGAQVASFSLARSNATRAVADLVVSVPNPSIVSILPLGDVALRIFFEGADMGFAVATNASLVASSTNNLTLAGVLESSNVTATNRLISAYLGGRAVAIEARGALYGPTSPLYQPVVSALALSAQLAGSSAPLISSIVVDGMFLQPISNEAVGVGLNATISVANPLGADSPIEVNSIALNCSLEGEGQLLGDLVVPTTVVSAVTRGWAWRAVGAGDDDDGVPPVAIVNISLQLSATLALQTTNTRFADFVLSFLQRSSVTLGLVSNSTSALSIDLGCALGALSVALPIESRTSVEGIGGFPSVALEGFAISGQRGRAILTDLNVSLFNPSPAAFPLGETATLGLYAGGLRLGYSVVVNSTLRPGANLLSIVGVLEPPPEALPAAAALISGYLAGANGSVTVVGEGVTMPSGATTPAWLLGAVQNISLAATLPGLPAAAAAALLSNLTLGELDLDFGADGLRAAPTVGGSVLAVLNLPFSLPDVGVVDLDLDLSFVEAGAGGAVMAQLAIINQTATWLPCGSRAACDKVLEEEIAKLGGAAACARPLAAGAAGPAGPAGASDPSPPVALVPVGVLLMRLAPTPLTIVNGSAFSGLLSSVLSERSVALRLRGAAAPRVNVSIGVLALTGVVVDQTVAVPGMGGFLNPPVVVTQGELFNTSRSGVDLFVNFNLTNPSPITGTLGPITLNIEYNGAVFITATIAPLVVARGANARSARGRFQPADPSVDPVNNAMAREALSRYLRGIDTPVIVRGGAAASPNPLIAPALNGFSTQAVFPGNPVPLITNGTLFLAGLYVRPSDNKTFVPGVLVSHNTLAVNLQIVNASLLVYLCQSQSSSTVCKDREYDDPIGFFSEAGDLAERPILVPAKSIFASAPYNITLVANGADLIAIGIDESIFGNILGKMSGNLTTALSSVNGSEPFALETFYEQEALQLFAK